MGIIMKLTSGSPVTFGQASSKTKNLVRALVLAPVLSAGLVPPANATHEDEISLAAPKTDTSPQKSITAMDILGGIAVTLWLGGLGGVLNRYFDARENYERVCEKYDRKNKKNEEVDKS
jgi:hypothetical protein